MTPRPRKDHRPPSPRPKGRPSMLNPTRMARFMQAIVAGNHMDPASRLVGTSYSTVKGWRNRGEHAIESVRVEYPDVEDVIDEWLQLRPDGFDATNPKWRDDGPAIFTADDWPYALFVVQLEHARAASEVRAIAELRGAGKKDWRAHAWWLERTMPERYGRTDRLQHGGIPGGEPIHVASVSVDDLMARLEGVRSGAPVEALDDPTAVDVEEAT